MPNGSHTNDAPQNSRPPSGGPSCPTPLTAATKTPLAMARGRTCLEERGAHGGPGLPGRAGNGLGRGPRDRFGEIEVARVLPLTEVRRAEQFLQADDLRARLRRAANRRQGAGEVHFRVRLAA